MLKWIRENKNSILVIFLMYVLQISAILRSNYLYADDMGRNMEGYTGNAFDSRYLADIISPLINANKRLTDVSPLTQILACLFLAVAAVLLLWFIRRESKLDILSLACAVMMMSPYFLMNMSYKVDAPFMALSVLLGFLPLLWKDELWKYVVAIVLCTLGICMTYQASSGILPMMVLILSFLAYIKGEKELKEILKFIGISAAAYLLSLGFFYVFLMKKVEGDEYFENSAAGITELFPTVISNIKTLYLTVVGDFAKWWNIFVVLIVIAFFVTCMKISTKKWYQTLLYLVITFGCMCVLVIGPYIVLRKPLLFPRSMYGFCILLAIMSAVIAQHNSVIAVPGKAIAVILAWCFFAFSFTYGNALFEQRRYTEFMMQEVASDLTDLDAYINSNEREVELRGTIGYCPVVENLPYDYDLVRTMIPIYFAQTDSAWNSYYFYHYLKLEGIKNVSGLDSTGFELVQQSAYHKIYNKGNQFIVELSYEYGGEN